MLMPLGYLFVLLPRKRKRKNLMDNASIEAIYLNSASPTIGHKEFIRISDLHFAAQRLERLFWDVDSVGHSALEDIDNEA